MLKIWANLTKLMEGATASCDDRLGLQVITAQFTFDLEISVAD